MFDMLGGSRIGRDGAAAQTSGASGCHVRTSDESRTGATKNDHRGLVSNEQRSKSFSLYSAKRLPYRPVAGQSTTEDLIYGSRYLLKAHESASRGYRNRSDDARCHKRLNSLRLEHTGPTVALESTFYSKGIYIFPLNHFRLRTYNHFSTH